MENVTAENISRAIIAKCGAEYKEKMQQARIAVAGLGGLGSNTAVLLCRMGVGHLHLLDHDRVDLANINRQQYFLEQIGKYKTEALAEILYKINPYIKLQIDNIKVTEADIVGLFQADDFICEAFDKAESKAMLVNGILENFTDKIVISGSGMAGTDSADLLRSKQVWQRLYICGDGVSDCKDSPLYAGRVAVCAGQQAHLAMRIILGLEKKQ